MKCNHCNKTIPEVSINCPYCREIVDPNAKPVVNFGELGLTDYDNKFDIKANNYEEIKPETEKSKKPLIIGASIGGAVLLIAVVALFLLTGGGTASGYTYYKAVSDELFNFLLENYTGSLDSKSGEYDLYLRIDEQYEYDFEGTYGLDTKNRILNLYTKLEDPRVAAGEIVIDANTLELTTYLEKNYLYFISEKIYDKEEAMMLPIDDDTGLLKTKKYDLASLISGVQEATNQALSKMTYELSSEDFVLKSGEATKVKKYTLVLDNKAKQTFLSEFFAALLDDGSFVGEYAKIMEVPASEAETILNNYKTSAEYKYSGKSDKKTTLAIYFNGDTIYRLEAHLEEGNNLLFQIDIGQTKYYFDYFKDDENIVSASLLFLTEEKSEYISKDYEITFDTNKFITDISLSVRQDKRDEVKKKKFEKTKSIQDFESKDFDKVKNNLSNYLHNVSWVEKLKDIFKEKCTTDLICECPINEDYCNCLYNDDVISCPVNKVKKEENKITTTTTKKNGEVNTTTTITTTTSSSTTSKVN